mmetsp:Transcript_74317/g.177064  ORF Transcript_74317/g.177064 Transcript_74317/m.177064 type:complete len:94 (-) Transcript_74317:274-555(-)
MLQLVAAGFVLDTAGRMVAAPPPLDLAGAAPGRQSAPEAVLKPTACIVATAVRVLLSSAVAVAVAEAEMELAALVVGLGRSACALDPAALALR